MDSCLHFRQSSLKDALEDTEDTAGHGQTGRESSVIYWAEKKEGKAAARWRSVSEGSEGLLRC